VDFAITTCTAYFVRLYENIKNARIQKKIQNAELVNNLFEKKIKVDKKYNNLLECEEVDGYH
jgi:hypothetical protein